MNARLQTEIDLNEFKIDLNESEHFLKANLDRSKIDISQKLSECECECERSNAN